MIRQIRTDQKNYTTTIREEHTQHTVARIKLHQRINLGKFCSPWKGKLVKLEIETYVNCQRRNNIKANQLLSCGVLRNLAPELLRK